MMNIKDNLDNRICDVENSKNTETYREFFIQSLIEFYGESSYEYDLDSMSNIELNELLEHLDNLWSK